VIDLLVVLAGMFATVSPFGALASVLWYRRDRVAAASPDPLDVRRLARWSPPAAFLVLAGAALVGGPLLDALSITPSTFEFAAAAAMVPLAIRLLVAGDSMATPRWQLPEYAWLFPFAVPLLAGPTSVIAAISYGQRIGEIETIVATAIALAIAAALFATLAYWERQRLFVVQMLGRASGLLLAGLALEMALDGLRAI
jgi:small neutral amino acid transporter SnatA (MarC family)